jgi:hypothetical protein
LSKPKSALAENEETFEHFCEHGWIRVRAAFSADEAAAMRAAAWRALAKVGIRESDPSTWTKERPERLQHVKDDPVFRAVSSAAAWIFRRCGGRNGFHHGLVDFGPARSEARPDEETSD